MPALSNRACKQAAYEKPITTMFRRLLFENWVSLFSLIAFITAASVYLTIFYRALRMKRAQIDRFSSRPFDAETPVSHDES